MKSGEQVLASEKGFAFATDFHYLNQYELDLKPENEALLASELDDTLSEVEILREENSTLETEVSRLQKVMTRIVEELSGQDDESPQEEGPLSTMYEIIMEALARSANPSRQLSVSSINTPLDAPPPHATSGRFVLPALPKKKRASDNVFLEEDVRPEKESTKQEEKEKASGKPLSIVEMLPAVLDESAPVDLNVTQEPTSPQPVTPRKKKRPKSSSKKRKPTASTNEHS
eukprot:m.39160 g.39160  ORF g.39160 m.39160 type:complete len:230 (+) comp16598_c0_seq1:75-764(+)